MAEIMRSTEAQEFWRPPMEELRNSGGMAADVDVCARCHSEFVMGSRYCHVCGMDRMPHGPSRAREFALRLVQLLDLNRARSASGLNTSAFVAFVIGILFLLAAVLVGVIYDAKTVLDWQAVQVWRAQWLLAALAIFVVAILLKDGSRTK